MHVPQNGSTLVLHRWSDVDGTLATLATLAAQHSQGERMAREWEHALVRYELFGSNAVRVHTGTRCTCQRAGLACAKNCFRPSFEFK